MKKGLRPEARHLILDRLFEHFPDEEGIKTSGQSMTSSSDGFEHFPDEEGIKTLQSLPSCNAITFEHFPDEEGIKTNRLRGIRCPDVRTLP